jgi:hypothetical protein
MSFSICCDKWSLFSSVLYPSLVPFPLCQIFLIDVVMVMLVGLVDWSLVGVVGWVFVSCSALKGLIFLLL